MTVSIMITPVFAKSQAFIALEEKYQSCQIENNAKNAYENVHADSVFEIQNDHHYNPSSVNNSNVAH